MRKNMRNSSFLLIACCLLALPSCYPMPKEGEYSLIPTTNNPDVVGSHGGNPLLPNGSF